MSKILVTGGAGYIGSFMVRELRSQGFEVVILDNLSQGHESAVKDFRLEKIDLVSEKQKIEDLFSSEKFDGVVHMASYIQMGESYRNPSKYYRNNVVGFLNLIDSMKDHNIGNIILSSSAGVYGNPVRVPILEDDLKNPLNPYGETKFQIERILEDYDAAYGIKFTSIRYFNAAGAALDGSIGEDHPEESHLIPNIIKSGINGSEFNLFGDDYDTPDGTCVRDYIHVLDLVEAHALAMNRLISGGNSVYYNAGIGRGYSNREIIAVVEDVIGSKIKVKILPKRQGDANALYADISKIKNELGWYPRKSIIDIIKSAYTWHSNHINGYDS